MSALVSHLPEAVNIIAKLHSSSNSTIFLANVQEQKCVMKVHRGRGPRQYYERADEELDIHVAERNAYLRFMDRGLCKDGIVPGFLGTMRHFDPSLFQPHLKHYMQDEHLPSALFIEYIPGLHMLELQDYTDRRMQVLLEGLDRIHESLVLHGDPDPRNIMVVPHEPTRVVWIDFDRSQTYAADQLSEKQQHSLIEERLDVEEFVEFLRDDFQGGKLDRATKFYFE